MSGHDKWVQDMLAKAAENKKTEPSAKNDVDTKDIEQKLKAIQNSIQRGESVQQQRKAA